MLVPRPTRTSPPSSRSPENSSSAVPHAARGSPEDLRSLKRRKAQPPSAKDGKPAGVTGSGKAIFKLGSGNLAALSGKATKFTTRMTGANRFELEFVD